MTQQVLAPSTRNPRLPAGCKAVDIFRRVHVAVLPRSAIGTRPISDVQRHLFLIRAALATGFATRKPAVYDHHAPPVPVRLVLDLPAEFAHAHVGNRSRDAVVFQHPGHVQVFQLNHVGTANNLSGGLMQEVSAHRRNVRVNLCDLDPLLAPAVTTFLHPCQAALLLFQVSQLLFQVPGIARPAFFRAIPADDDILNSQVQAHGSPGQRQRLNLDFTGKRHEIAPVGCFAHRRHFRDSCRNLRPADIQKAELGQFQEFARLIGAGDMPLVQLIANRLAVKAGFEFRITGFLTGFDPAKEGVEGFILVYQALRQTAGGGIRQPREFTALPFRHLLIERDVVMPGLIGFPRRAAQFQTAIPDEPTISELHRQLMPLFGGGFKTKFIGFLSDDHSCYDNVCFVKQQGESGGTKPEKSHDESHGIAGIQGVATPTRRSAKPQHDFVYRMAGAARRGENRTEEPARIGASRAGGRPAPGGPANAPRAAWPVRSLRNAFFDHRGRRASVRSSNGFPSFVSTKSMTARLQCGQTNVGVRRTE